MPMSKIGLFISSSNQCLFQRTTGMLKEHYKNIIRNNGYDIDVFSFQGGLNIDNTVLFDDTILCNADDRNIALKYRECFNFLLSNGIHYDWVIFTNTSTLVNLPMFVNNIQKFNEDTVYTQIICEFDEIDLKFPMGNFYMFSYNILNKIFDVFDESYNEGYQYVHSRELIPDDVVIGYVIQKLNISITKIGNTINIFGDTGIKTEISHKINETPIIRFRSQLPYKQRVEFEPKVLSFLIKQFC